LLEAGLSPTTGPDESALILRRAGIAALVVSISAGMMSNMLFLASFQFRLDRFLEPTLILGSARPRVELLRWAARYRSAETLVVRASNSQHPETPAPGDEVQRPSLPRGLRSALCTSSRRKMLLNSRTAIAEFDWDVAINSCTSRSSRRSAGMCRRGSIGFLIRSDDRSRALVSQPRRPGWTR
jgi:hypothetical protein